jgi:hypothetical protein
MQKHKKTLALLAILSLIVSSGAFNGLVKTAQAVSLTNAKDTLSTSNMSDIATHTIQFTIKTPFAGAGSTTIQMPGVFGDAYTAANVTCSGHANLTAAGTKPGANQAGCDVTGAIPANTVVTMVITGVSNPVAAGSQHIYVTTSAGDRADVMVAIISNVAVSVTVPSTLLFVISPVATGTVVNTATTTAQSATTSIAFGNLEISTSSIMAQQLQVTTNAEYGYTVTVEQNQNLTSNSGSDIDSFVDGTSTTEQIWQAPGGLLDVEWTYGHMGLTSDDSTLNVRDFNGGKYKGFDGVTPMEVMYHTGPSDGSTQNKGAAKVAYRIEISPLQEAGDYYNTLTYIATPTY